MKKINIVKVLVMMLMILTICQSNINPIAGGDNKAVVLAKTTTTAKASTTTTKKTSTTAKKETAKKTKKDTGSVKKSSSGTYGDPDDLANILDPSNGVGAIIYDFARVSAAILTFISVIMIGFNIILARNKVEERTNAMSGFTYIIIGIIILDSVLIIYSLIAGLVGNPSAQVKKGDVVIVQEYNM